MPLIGSKKIASMKMLAVSFTQLQSQAKIFVLLFFSAVLVLGINIYQDFGISFDEAAHRERGIVTLNYIGDLWGIKAIKTDPILTKFRSLPPLNLYLEGKGGSAEHGVAFDLLEVTLERILNIGNGTNQQAIYHFRHLLSFLVFFGGLVALYQLSTRRFSSQLIGALTVVFMLLSPRFFAESFFNAMDLAYLAFFTIALNATIRYLLRPSVLNVIICAIACGLAIDIRNTGIVLLLMVITINVIQGLRKEISWLRLTQYIAIFSVVVCLTILAFWPWLWANPLYNFYYALKVLSKIPVDMDVLYLGNIITATNIPWHYPLVWIGISTPLLYIGLFLIGSGYTAGNILYRNVRLWASNNELQDWLFFAIFFCPLIAVISLHSVIFDGWRHLYFIYPAFLLLTTKGLLILWNYCKTYLLKIVFISLISANCIWIGIWMIQAHPLQNLYFNRLIPPGWNQQFEVDYWGLSARQGLEYIAKLDGRDQIQVLPGGLMNLGLASQILIPKDAERFIPADNADNYDYLVTAFRANPKPINSPTLIPIKNFYVDNEIVLAVYKHLSPFPIQKPIEPGQSISFNSPMNQALNAGNKESFIFGLGWSKPESWGTWTNDKTATLSFPADSFVPSFKPTKLVLMLKGFILPAHPTQTILIYINNALIKTVQINTPEIKTIEIPLSNIPNFTAPIEIKFELPNATSPQRLGMNDDRRTLAIGLISLAFY